MVEIVRLENGDLRHSKLECLYYLFIHFVYGNMNSYDFYSLLI